jgi:hypothetical protein
MGSNGPNHGEAKNRLTVDDQPSGVVPSMVLESAKKR